MKQKTFLNNHGILLVAMMIMFTLITLAAIFLQRVVASGKTAQAQVDRIQALYAAEAGLQKAIYYLNYTAPDSTVGGSYRIGTATSLACPSSGGTAGRTETLTITSGNTATYTMCIEDSTLTKQIMITSTGTVVSGPNGNITRTVQAYTSGSLLSGVAGSSNTAELAGRWTFSEGSGTSAADSSGNSHTGTLTGSPTWGTAALHDGITRGTLTFSGSNYVLINATMLQTGAFTVMAWVNPTASQISPTTGSGFLGNAQNAGSNGQGYHMGWFNSSGTTYIRFAFEEPDTTSPRASMTNTASAGTWYHIAGVFDGASTGTIYLNGSSGGTSTSIKNLYTASYNLRLGYDPQSTSENWANPGFNGSLADVRVYSRALSGDEIAQIYNGSGTCIKMLRGSFKEL